MINTEKQNLMPLQKRLALKLVNLHYQTQTGHLGCSLSCLQLIIGFVLLNRDPKDVFILSKAHAGSALYVCLNELQEIDDQILATYMQNGTTLGVHPVANCFPRIKYTLGSLGHGLPIATGLALAKKLKKESGLVIVLLSDGETNSGSCWEAMHFAKKHNLNNLVVIIDHNGFQGFGATAEVLGDTASPLLWRNFSNQLIEINGHDQIQINNSLITAQNNSSSEPMIIIANTIKGHGISFLENSVAAHYQILNEEQHKRALLDLQKYA
ncbi:MAG: transketolase [Candidatus Komeilibacteria bacterium CG_4_10_14_0_2_um_filter_37_10]|uniref:Transketolase n=1 Tax=Candidatus Komeilibacteria bacterium CG_4_10_14_0_2_um_filter_37_10 TaxID=1974470 RepID=A0A2M7VEJ0_9BACT|nr:MAG: transketolase [Candidatus Komeilibacteria bacterium CG_4_10_14_0_2_um_filter_37_10]